MNFVLIAALTVTLAFVGRAETFEMGARASMTPVELNCGDVCRFTLRNGETRSVEYLGGSASVLEIPITEGLVASQTMTVRVDGVAIPFRRYFVSHALPQYGKETDRLGLFQSLTERIENLPVLPARIAADGTLVPASPKELPVAIDAWCHTINHLFYMYVTWEKPLRARWLPVFERTLARLRFEGGLPVGCDLRTAVLFSRGLQGVGTHLCGTYAAVEKLRTAVAALRATGMKDRRACAKLIVAIDSVLSGIGLVEYY